MAKDSMIRWRQGDYIKLGRAVSEFNKKVKRLEQEQEALGLPDLIDYQKLKSEIVTRKELNRQLQALRSFKEAGAEELTKQTEEPMTKWEYKQLQSLKRTAVKKAKAEIESLRSYDSGLMGQARVQELEGSIKSIEQFAKATGKKLLDIKMKLKYFGTSDSSMKHAIIFRENYLKEMEKYSNFRRFDELMDYLYSIKNPLDFYEMLNSKGELVSDLYYQSNQTYSEENFSAFVSEVLGKKSSGKMQARREGIQQDYYIEQNKKDIGSSHSDVLGLKQSNISEAEREAGFAGFQSGKNKK